MRWQAYIYAAKNVLPQKVIHQFLLEKKSGTPVPSIESNDVQFYLFKREYTASIYINLYQPCNPLQFIYAPKYAQIIN